MSSQSELSIFKSLASLIFPPHLLDYFDVVSVEERPIHNPRGLEQARLYLSMLTNGLSSQTM